MALINSSHSNSNRLLPALSSADFSTLHLYSAENGILQNPSKTSLVDSHSRERLSKSQAKLLQEENINTYSRRRSTLYTTKSSKSNRTGLFNLAALGRDKNSSSVAPFNEPRAPTRPSIAHSRDHRASFEKAKPVSSQIGHHGDNDKLDFEKRLEQKPQRQSLLKTNHPSQDTHLNSPAPSTLSLEDNSNKMHQTSSRLLRMTDEERPFTRDFADLFATLVVSLPLSPHRIRLTRIEHSFLSEEAINNLGSLKFSQSNRMPDPKDPSRIVTTTTTTTFSMAREMARSVCQKFLEARFIESADGKQAKEFTMKGSVWQLTPKGIHVLDRFCSRNGILQRHTAELVNSSRNVMQLVILERDSATDKLSADRSTIEVIFRRFIGQHGPNVKVNASSADADSMNEYKDGIAGVKMAHERKLGLPPRSFLQTFTGKAATDWLMDCSTTVDRAETIELAGLFLDQELIWCVQADKAHAAQFPREAKFQPTKNAIYQMTKKGKDVVNMIPKEKASNGDEAGQATRPGVSRDSNTQKLDKILNDAALRLLFRENLRDTHCEENLSFYLDVDEFLKSCRIAVKGASPNHSGKSTPSQGLDAVRETMASAYGIYNAFLAPGSPCELNIDHLLRNQLATRMTKAVGQDSAMVDSLREVTQLFEEAQVSVFKLMASDSVPKFMKSAKYEQTLKTYDFDSMASSSSQSKVPATPAMPSRSLSKTTR